MSWFARRPGGTGEAEYLIDRMTVTIQHGRFERSLSGLTAAAALITTAEVFIEHYKASFVNKSMWSLILVTPPVVISGIAGVYSKRWAKTALPMGPPIAAPGLMRIVGGMGLLAPLLRREK